MRKILTLTGSCLLALSLAACGASNAGSDKSQTPSKKTCYPNWNYLDE